MDAARVLSTHCYSSSLCPKFNRVNGCSGEVGVVVGRQPAWVEIVFPDNPLRSSCIFPHEKVKIISPAPKHLIEKLNFLALSGTL